MRLSRRTTLLAASIGLLTSAALASPGVGAAELPMGQAPDAPAVERSAAALAPKRPGTCGASPAANGTGYVPSRAPAPVAATAPRPGPDILYWPLASSPQLENTGDWTAEPILISGSSAYREGEFLYQDFLYDDRGLPYPDEPATYARNAADLVEVRVRTDPRGMLVRLTYNSMLEPELVAATIALGDSAEALPLPHGAGASMPAEVFVTVHGCEGHVVRARDGVELATPVTVTTDLLRRQVQVHIPHAAFDARREREVRLAAAAGLWNAETRQYQRPDPERPAFYNVAFRDKGPWSTSTWKDESQEAALRTGDLSPFAAVVDLGKLRRGIDDEMSGLPAGVPTSGPMNRILVSHFEDAQGRGDDPEAFTLSECEPPCRHMYAGRLQPYTVYVPAVAKPQSGYGLVVNLHGAGGNHNHFEPGTLTPSLSLWQMLSEAGRPSIMVQPNARGTVYFYKGMAAAEVFEVWADIAARYPLDPRYVVQTGSSMGGFGSYKLAAQYPDLYSAVFPNVAATGAAGGFGPMDPGLQEMLASLRNLPVLATQGSMDALVPPVSTTTTSAALDLLGYRHDHWYFSGQEGFAGHAEYRHYVRDGFAALSRSTDPAGGDPRRVSYVVNARLADAERYGLNSDHAYWLSDVALRDPAASPTGSIDVTSAAFGRGDPQVLPPEASAGASANGSPAYWRFLRRWASAGDEPIRDALVVAARNIASITVDVDRARVTCEADVDLVSDGPLDIQLVGRSCTRAFRAMPATLPRAASPGGLAGSGTGAGAGVLAATGPTSATPVAALGLLLAVTAARGIRRGSRTAVR